MIRTVSSSLPTFKSLTFKSGLNVLLADVAEASTDKHTRNSAGKTSLIEIIHFVLGSDVKKGSLFKDGRMEKHRFSVELYLQERWVRASRTGANDGRIHLATDDANALGLRLEFNLLDEEGYLSVDAWKSFLGENWFKLPGEHQRSNAQNKGAPTFRSLIPYFIRRRKDGGFDTIEKHGKDQQPGSWQVALSYLFGLDWGVAYDFQSMRERRRNSETLRKAVAGGEFGNLFGKTSELRPEIARVEQRISILRTQVDKFEVHDSYREMADRAALLKDRLNQATYDLSEVEAALQYMNKAVQEEAPPAYTDVERLYRSAGIELPDVALRRFDDVKAFQASVTFNRLNYLREQIEETRERKRHLETGLREASAQRSDILKTLEGKGAFEDLLRLREDLGKLTSTLETLRSKLEYATGLENDLAQLKAEAAELLVSLQQNHATDESAIKRATVLVDRAIGHLYDDRTGNLIIEASSSGPKFSINIDGGGNKGGIDMMKIFCFDTTLLRIAYDRFHPGPRMLVHDSHLFDGVDSRQVAQALAYAKELVDEIGGQYIVALNSDEFEKADSVSDVALSAYANPTKLADNEQGGLFGFRFTLAGQ